MHRRLERHASYVFTDCWRWPCTSSRCHSWKGRQPGRAKAKTDNVQPVSRAAGPCTGKSGLAYNELDKLNVCDFLCNAGRSSSAISGSACCCESWQVNAHDGSSLECASSRSKQDKYGAKFWANRVKCKSRQLILAICHCNQLRMLATSRSKPHLESQRLEEPCVLAGLVPLRHQLRHLPLCLLSLRLLAIETTQLQSRSSYASKLTSLNTSLVTTLFMPSSSSA